MIAPAANQVIPIDDLCNAPGGAPFDMAYDVSFVRDEKFDLSIQCCASDIFTLYLEMGTLDLTKTDNDRCRVGIHADISRRENEEIKQRPFTFLLPKIYGWISLIVLKPGNPCPLSGIPRKITVENEYVGTFYDSIGRYVISPVRAEFDYPKIVLGAKLPYAVHSILHQSSDIEGELTDRQGYNVMQSKLFGSFHQGYDENCLCNRKPLQWTTFAIGCIKLSTPSKLEIITADEESPECILPEEFYSKPNKLP